MKTARSSAGLIVSGCLNLALAALLIALARSPGKGRGESAPNPQPFAKAQEDLSRSANAHTEFVADGFHWGALESPDFQVYAANLRAIGCPETTVQDIIIAAVERRYAGRRVPLRPRAGFWSCGPGREAAMKEREQANAALDREQRDLLLAVLGTFRCQQSGQSSHEFIELAI